MMRMKSPVKFIWLTLVLHCQIPEYAAKFPNILPSRLSLRQNLGLAIQLIKVRHVQQISLSKLNQKC